MKRCSDNKLTLASFGTVLYCRNWKECVDFYLGLFNCPIAFRNEFFVELLPSPGVRLGLMDVSRTKKRETAPESIVISIQVNSLDRALEFVQNIFPDLADPVDHPWGVKLIELRDPDGRLVEIWEAKL